MSNAHKPFFSRLSYSFGNEDWRVERKALNIRPTDRVICVTASGDRPLNLLMDPCAELISIDLNETQNFLLSLKVHAMKNLGFKEYLAFLGASNCDRRLENLAHLTPKLEKRSAQFWNQHKLLIQNGVLFQGAIEKWCKRFAGLMNFLRGKKINRLFEFDNLSEQQKFLKEEWNTYLWQKSCQIICHPKI
ncbi:MAG: DUF3419 family protein, partial [Parachlamydiaceae bacterium]|nr:DUF3419 family protein [Parachlamydiaceae bacterium]